MAQRFSMGKVQPEAYKAMDALDKYVSKTSIPRLQQELIRIKVSQINGCSYCVSSHSTDARKFGETESRIYLISAWKEAPNVFNEEEWLLLAMAEEITLIHQHGLSDELYEKVIALFGEQRTAEIIMTIITINAWNRIGVGLKMQPAF
ncbi:MAG: carboxymuconolactone decarboxylase family protein [Chitinophagaceae bacterium]|nr:carboxymuconolactone decarboxylase family protein [Chitinophagaceae bacterium]